LIGSLIAGAIHLLLGLGTWCVLRVMPPHMPTAVGTFFVDLTYRAPRILAQDFGLAVLIPVMVVYSLLIGLGTTIIIIVVNDFGEIRRWRVETPLPAHRIFNVIVGAPAMWAVSMVGLTILSLVLFGQLTPDYFHVHSHINYPDRQTRVEALHLYLMEHPSFSDAEYHLTGHPAWPRPKAWSYQVAMKIRPGCLDELTAGHTPVTRTALERAHADLLQVDEHKPLSRWSPWSRVPHLDMPTWQHTSPAEYYLDGGTCLIVHRRERIVLYEDRK